MIRVENLSFSYPRSNAPVLHNLQFEVKKGEIFGFLGPSGAGKSTTQKILYKVLHGYDGDIDIDDRSLKAWDKKYFENIGVGFELPNHYLKLSGRENLKLFAAFYPAERIAGFDELFDVVDLRDDIDRRVEEYSKGMKMRLNYIRAIMHNPDILFFDEPTAGLDPINAKRIKDHIVTLKTQGKTIFVTTHDMATADEICDRVSFIVDGRLVLTDNPKKLKNEHGKRLVEVELESGRSENFRLDDLGLNQDFIDFLNAGAVRRINSQEASLEEVFIKVTGKELRK